MISAIIPTYRNPDYLDLCLKSAMENKVDDDTEVIVIIDGYPEESQEVVEKYEGVQVLPLPQNMGMQYALNIGVMNASNEWIFIVNDDNIFGTKWDTRIKAALAYFVFDENLCLTINQVEPSDGIFNFVTRDLGRTAATFDYDEWIKYESKLSDFPPVPLASDDGRIFPFVLTKKWYQAVGGFDTFYKSPFWCDVDFFTKLEITNQIEFHRWHGAHLYHFGSIATKNRGDAEAELFKRSEGPAAQSFQYKWGFVPNIVENTRLRGNQKSPVGESIKGIKF